MSRSYGVKIVEELDRGQSEMLRWKPTWFERAAAAAAAVPVETKQALLDRMWAGATLGEAAAALGLNLEQSCGILNENIEQTRTLRRKVRT